MQLADGVVYACMSACPYKCIICYLIFRLICPELNGSALVDIVSRCCMMWTDKIALILLADPTL